MGLDLYHLKATLEPQNPGEAFRFYEDDFDAHALDVLGLRRFIRTIPDHDYPTRILIVKDEEARRRLETDDSWRLREAYAVLMGEPGGFDAEVERIERLHGLNPSERTIGFLTTLVWDDGTWSVDGRGGSSPDDFRWGPPDVADTARMPRANRSCRLKSQYMAINYSIPTSFQGLYAEEVGYLRKSMSDVFYTQHRGLNPSARFADVRHTYFLVDWDRPSYEHGDVQTHFLKQFVVPFEPGRSLIYASF